jgi:hypothetical protein
MSTATGKWLPNWSVLVAGMLALAHTASQPDVGFAEEKPSTQPALSSDILGTRPNALEEVCFDGTGNGLLSRLLYSDLPVDWSRVPPVRVYPRTGDFPVPPSGPGYYSLYDWLTGNYRQAPPKFPYSRFGLMPPSFFDADFRYLDDPNNTDYDWSDFLHRIYIGDNWLFATGGQFWSRYMHEVNSRLSGFNNDYTLIRTRVWADLWYRDLVRVYAEFLDAHSFRP